MSVDKWLGKKYDPENYNCLHLARDVWLEETGEDLSERLDGLLVPKRERRLRKKNRKAFKRIDEPASPCIVVMQHPQLNPHVGVYLRGRVLHIQKRGVEFLPVDIASRGFETAKFYQ